MMAFTRSSRGCRIAQAAFPAAWVRQAKFWPSCSRVDNVYGDRHLVSRLAQEEVPLEAVAA